MPSLHLTYALQFSHFKRGQLNPHDVPTGKKSLNLVKERVIAKAQTIRPANITMYWHLCLHHLYKYLCFVPN